MGIQTEADVHFSQQGNETAKNINKQNEPQLLQSNRRGCWTLGKTLPDYIDLVFYLLQQKASLITFTSFCPFIFLIEKGVYIVEGFKQSSQSSMDYLLKNAYVWLLLYLINKQFYYRVPLVRWIREYKT